MNTIFQKAGIVAAIAATILLPSCSDDDATTPKDETAPDITLSSSATSTTVWNTVKLTATATDDQGIEKIEIKIDGTSAGTATTSPYELSWDTQKIGDGSHTATAIVTDKSGNEKSVELKVTVQNTLFEAKVDTDMLGKNEEGYQARGFIFLSDNDGKVIVAQEFKNGDAIALKVPGFEGTEFSVTEAITDDSDTDIALITSTHVNRGKWVLNSETEDDDEPVVSVGDANLTFTNRDANADYMLTSNYHATSSIQLDNTAAIGLYKSPSLLYVVSIDKTSGEQKAYVYPSIATGVNAPLDLALVTKPIIEENIQLSPELPEAYLSIYGMRAGATDGSERINVDFASADSKGKMTISHPGDAFPAYYSITELFGPEYTAYISSHKVYDVTPLAAKLDASLANGKLTIAASGTMDYYHVDLDGDTRWVFVADKSVTSIVIPEVPSILKDYVATDMSDAYISISAEDYAPIDSYSSLLNFVRASENGYNDLPWGNNNEVKTLYKDIDNSGGRKGSRTKREYYLLGSSKPHTRRK